MGNKSTLKAGDKVLLNSGSPILTVGDIFEDDESCSVSWYKDNTINTEVLPMACLTKYSETKGL